MNISPIYTQATSEPPTGQEARNRNHAAFQKAWHEHGLVIIDPSTIQDDWLRQGLINEAVKRYLRRAGD